VFFIVNQSKTRSWTQALSVYVSWQSLADNSTQSEPATAVTVYKNHWVTAQQAMQYTEADTIRNRFGH